MVHVLAPRGLPRSNSHFSYFVIPGIVIDARKAHPVVAIDYAWPFDDDFIADFLAARLSRAPLAR